MLKKTNASAKNEPVIIDTGIKIKKNFNKFNVLNFVIIRIKNYII